MGVTEAWCEVCMFCGLHNADAKIFLPFVVGELHQTEWDIMGFGFFTEQLPMCSQCKNVHQ